MRTRCFYGPEGTGGGAGGGAGAGGDGGQPASPGQPQGAGGGGGGNPAGGAPGASGGGGDPGGAAGRARPDWCPEQFWNPETSGVRVQELAKAWTDARGVISRGVDGYKAQYETQRAEEIAKIRPADPTGYKIEPPKALAGKVQIHVGAVDESRLDPKVAHFKLNPNDPMVGWWQQTCHKLGLGQEAFSEGVGAFIQSMQSRAPDFDAEMKKLGDNGKVRIDAARNWLKGNTTEATFKLFERVALTADGVQAIEELIAKAGGPKLADGGAPPPPPSDEQYTETQLRQMMSDERYWNPGKRDDAFVKKVKDGWARLKPGVLSANSHVKAGAAAS